MIANKAMYKNSTLFSKLYGLTYDDRIYQGIHYEKNVERDFHDLLFQYGIIGFIIELSLPLYLLLSILIKIIKTKKNRIDEEICILATSTAFVLLGSYLAGHFLFAPAVSIYVAYSIALLSKKVGNI